MKAAEGLLFDWAWPLFWLLATLAAYYAAKALYRRHPAPWSAPLVLAPLALLLLAAALHARYADYLRGTHWLSAMLGPATVAFALPVYQQRALIRKHWPLLCIGVAVGSSVAILSAWGMATVLHLPEELRLSLAPRSITTPLAMDVSKMVGGVPGLTAVFVMLTGVCGAMFGQLMLRWLPLRSGLARGAMFGMAAHGMGVAKAREIGDEEGAIAGLVMVMAGMLNVFAGPLLIRLL